MSSVNVMQSMVLVHVFLISMVTLVIFAHLEGSVIGANTNVPVDVKTVGVIG